MNWTTWRSHRSLGAHHRGGRHHDRAIAAGHGTENWTALYEAIKPQR